MNTLQLLASDSQAQQEQDAQVGVCGRVWHVGFFFDGIGRNIEQDASTNRLSNIARLFRAHPDETSNTANDNYIKFYFPGLGTPYKEDLSSKLSSIMDISRSIAKSVAKDKGKEFPQDVLKDTAKEALKTNWYEALSDTKGKLLNVTEWRKMVREVLGKIARKVAIEAVPALRDDPTIAAFFITGVETYLTAAKSEFKTSYLDVKKPSKLPIKLISISVFGFDLGATIARKFIDQLLSEVCQKKGEAYFYQDAKVDIIFTGFFDCSRHTPATSNVGFAYFVNELPWVGKVAGPLLGDKSIDQQTPLPAVVRQSLHLVAAHERRPWRCLYPLGYKGEWQEELFPGCSNDVGGGLLADEQKPSAELYLAALHKMYVKAYSAGVPFPDYDSLKKKDKVVASYLIMNDAVEGKSAEGWMRQYQRKIPVRSLSQSAQELHLDAYIRWLGEQYYRYVWQMQDLDEQGNRSLASGANAAGIFGVSPQGKAQAEEYRQKQQTLRNNWGWLEEVHQAALGLRNDLLNSPNDNRLQLCPEIYGRALKRAEQYLNYYHCAYRGDNMPAPTDHAPDEIFAYFVHDVWTLEPTAMINQDFFVIRAADSLEEE